MTPYERNVLNGTVLCYTISYTHYYKRLIEINNIYNLVLKFKKKNINCIRIIITIVILITRH